MAHISGLMKIAAVCLLSAALLTGAADNINDALAALQRGDFQTAEHSLRAELQAHPDNPAALTLLGVALDNLKRFDEAAAVHRRALAAAPDSPDVLNNYANHLLAGGDEPGAAKLYEKVVAIDPAHVNANLQLAQLAVKQRRGADALACLNRLPAAQQAAPQIGILRMSALYLSSAQSQADALAVQLAEAGKANLQLTFSVAVALANAGQFAKAEEFFTEALNLAPADFNVLFNLGAVAARAGHTERARDVLQSALQQQPENIDVLYQLASVQRSLNQSESAVRLVARASKLAPRRADILELLALATADLGALEDAAAVWDRYLALKPDDDSARRERAFTLVRMGRFDEGIAGLRAFLKRHPDDAEGRYQLGVAVGKDDPSAGIAELDRALSLKPDFAAAHSARGGFYYQIGKPEIAVADLDAAARLEPGRAANLDRLGQTYIALDRTADAVRVLRQAAALAPDDSKVQLHFARALSDAGETAEGKQAMDRFRQLGPAEKKGIPGGLIDYLSMSSEQRRADYRGRLEKLIADHPDDAAAQLDYLELQLDEGAAQSVESTVRRLAEIKSNSAVLAKAGRALLESAHYAEAKDLLGRIPSPAPEAQLDLALAVLRGGDAEAAARQLNAIPEASRGADFYVARAQIQLATGHADAASAALDVAADLKTVRPALIRETAGLLIDRGHPTDALRLLDSAVGALPDNRSLCFTRSLTLELAGRTSDSLAALKQAQSRWPEWNGGWLGYGAILAIHGQVAEARRDLDTAVALGAAGLAEPWIQAVAGREGAAPSIKDLAFSKPPRDW